MTTHRRGLLLRAAAVGALVSGAVLLPATAALANVSADPGNLTMNAGDEKSIKITVTNADAINPQAQVSAQGLGNEVSLRGPGGCSGNGSQSLNCNNNAFEGDDNEKTLTITVSSKNPSGLQPNQTREGSINVEGRAGNDSVNILLKGPQQAASASEVNGTITDQTTGDAVPGAQVSLKDSAGNTLDVTANNQGKYTIKSSQGKPIAPGQVTVTASKEGYADGTATGNAQSGKALTVAVRMKPTSASATPSAPVASDTQPTEAPTGDTSGLAQPGKNTSGEDGGTSMLSWVLIGMGVLLVLLGIGAIVLLVMRRKDDGDDPDGFGHDPNQMVPAGAGAYAGGPAATMVGGRPNMNDQTAIVGPQQQLDEFPDPYAAPPPAPAPTRVGGGAYSGGYNDTQATGVAPGYGRGGGGANGNGGGYRDERGYGEGQRGGGYGEEPRGGYGAGGAGGAGGYGAVGGGAVAGGAGAGGYGAVGGGAGGGGGDRYADQPTGHYQGGGDQGGYPAAGGFPSGASGSDYGANGYGGAGANGYGGGAANGAAYGGGGGYGGGANGAANGAGGGGGYGGAPIGGGANGYGGGGYEDEYGRGGGGGFQGGAQGGQQGGAQGGQVGQGGQQAGGYERGGDYAGDQRNGRNRSVDWLE